MENTVPRQVSCVRARPTVFELLTCVSFEFVEEGGDFWSDGVAPHAFDHDEVDIRPVLEVFLFVVGFADVFLCDKFDFIVSRAVAQTEKIVSWNSKNLSDKHNHLSPNGFLLLKGGDLEEELKPFKKRAEQNNISDFFDEPFFETKKIVYLPKP